MKRPQGIDPSVFDLSRRFASIALMGPPLSDKVIRLIEHIFTPGEAAVAVGVPNYVGMSAELIAKKLKRNPAEIQPYLDSMSTKRIIMRLADDKGVTYALLPIVPGMFEMVLMKGDDTEWHRKYAELFEELYSTGYVRDSVTRPLPGVKSIPVELSLPGESVVLPSDRFSELLQSHTDMAVINVCQCRQAKRLIDKTCKRSKPEDGCLSFGTFASYIEKEGLGRRVSREEMTDIAAERNEKGLVFFTGNVKFSNPNAICTCCDCCCDFLRCVNEFGTIGLVAPAHFIAKVDDALCNNCGKCTKRCNTYAHTMQEKKHLFNSAKCIGCGLCIRSCKEDAISMVANPAYKPPSENFLRLGLRLLPNATAIAIKRKLTGDSRLFW
jgi:ferredoxin